MRDLTLQVRTRDDLGQLLASGESPAWVVARRKEPLISRVRVVNFAGTEMIEGSFDPSRSRRRDDGRLIVAIADARIRQCDISFDARNVVRYFPA